MSKIDDLEKLIDAEVGNVERVGDQVTVTREWVDATVTVWQALPQLLAVVRAAERLTYRVLAQREIQDDELSALAVSELKDTLDSLDSSPKKLTWRDKPCTCEILYDLTWAYCESCDEFEALADLEDDK